MTERPLDVRDGGNLVKGASSESCSDLKEAVLQ